MSRIKLLSIATLAVLVTAVMLAIPSQIQAQAQTTGQDNQMQQIKPPKPAKCDNIKIQAKVTGVKEGTTEVTGTAILSSGATVTRVSGVDENETSVTLNFNFKKATPCPSQGDTATVEISGDTFSAVQASVTIKDVNKPNKVSIDVSQSPAPLAVQAQVEG